MSREENIARLVQGLVRVEDLAAGIRGQFAQVEAEANELGNAFRLALQTMSDADLAIFEAAWAKAKGGK